MAEQRKLTKNEKKRLKAKEKKVYTNNNDEQHTEISKEIKTKQEENDDNINNLEIEYVSANPFDSINDQNIINQFQSVMLKFNPKQESEDLLLINQNDESAQLKLDKDKQEAEEAEALAITTANKLSKKKKKLLSRLSVAGNNPYNAILYTP